MLNHGTASAIRDKRKGNPQQEKKQGESTDEQTVKKIQTKENNNIK